MKNYSSKFKIKKTINYQRSTIKNQLNNHGFSLIELLVVVAILAMIMTVLFPNFMGARQRARDAQRKGDLSQIQKSLELYKLDQSPQNYPTTGAFPVSLCGQCWSSGAGCTGNIYMRKFPCDPATANITPYIYKPDVSDKLKYAFSACLENFADPDRDATVEPTCAATNTSYTIHEP